jgi:hypothetical protein
MTQFVRLRGPLLMTIDEAKNTMLILMDKILAECADKAYETARLRRNGVHTARDRVSAATLAELEAAGDAMRYANSRGRIAWKATPNLCQYLKDLELDAKADLEDF